MTAILPLIVFIIIYLGTSIVMGDFYKVPITVAFLISAIVSIATMRNKPLAERMKIFSNGASSENMMMMLWIFILAGAFASSAKTMGSIDATVEFTEALLPTQMIAAGMFLSACFISLAVGTSVGTIAALVPIASGLADSTGISVPMMTAIVVGGAFFGDNLSFISDTTVVATQTQGCQMSDKFKANFRIVLPAAIAIFVLYIIIGVMTTGDMPSDTLAASPSFEDVSLVLILPYMIVIAMAIYGFNVMMTLTIGCITTGIIGTVRDSFDIFGWMQAMSEGILGMSELIIVTMLAGGMLEVVRQNGGINAIIDFFLRHVNNRRGGEMAIAALVTIVDFCTANNTVAIITVGPIARQIAERYDIEPRRTASILDTFSCFAQSIIPYGAQLLIAAGLAAVNPVEIIPNLFYPMALCICATATIVFTRKQSHPHTEE